MIPRHRVGRDFLGQRIASGLRVPPRCDASSFTPLYGVLPAQPQPEWYWLSVFGEPRTSRPPSCSRASMCIRGVVGMPFGKQFGDGAVLALG